MYLFYINFIKLNHKILFINLKTTIKYHAQNKRVLSRIGIKQNLLFGNYSH